MSRREVCFIIGKGGVILSGELSDSPLALPDARRRWETIWGLREEVAEIAHSHPLGPDDFSTEDLTTMAALDSALGRALRYSVVFPAGWMVRQAGHRLEAPAPEPWWAVILRAASGMP